VSSYQAIVIGATGAVGSSLVRELIASPLCKQVTAVVRRELPEEFFDDPANKVRVQILDMDNLGTEAIAAARHCDAAFCTMGIGQPRKVTKEQFWKVDVEYALAFARACKLAGVQHFSLLSSVGANAESRSNYLRVKGTVEERLASIGFARVSLFRPSLLVTKYVRYGLQDRLTQALFPVVAKFLSPKFHQIKVEELGRAMRMNAERPGVKGIESLTYPEFRKLLDPQTDTAKATTQGEA
jgi:uncharacterized protein YbjT (DUF2867 family)